jgi:hypothetical protein
MLTDSSLRTFIMRMSHVGGAPEKRYQKAFPKINALSMTS